MDQILYRLWAILDDYNCDEEWFVVVAVANMVVVVEQLRRLEWLPHSLVDVDVDGDTDVDSVIDVAVVIVVSLFPYEYKQHLTHPPYSLGSH